MGQTASVSFRNVAVSGATAALVRCHQLDEAVGHRPQLASLIVGMNDTMRSTWDPVRLRDDLFTCADALHGVGAVLLTARFHDHGAVLGLPGVLRRPLWRRIENLNAVYDEITTTYGGLTLDLSTHPDVADRAFWSIDRMHPSELGHRQLARRFATMVNELGLAFPLPSLVCNGIPASRTSDTRWLITEGVPWMGRRAKDLGPWAVRMACADVAALVQAREGAAENCEV
jgi:lysophospholipase L1-like esterase